MTSCKNYIVKIIIRDKLNNVEFLTKSQEMMDPFWFNVWIF